MAEPPRFPPKWVAKTKDEKLTIIRTMSSGMLRIVWDKDQDLPCNRYAWEALRDIFDTVHKTPGLVAFYEFRSPITIELMGAVQDELWDANPDYPDLDVYMLEEVHEILCGKDYGSLSKHGEKLPFDCIEFFLEACQTFKDEIYLRYVEDPLYEPAVLAALKQIETHRRSHPGSRPDKDRVVYHMVLAVFSEIRQSVDKYLKDTAVATAAKEEPSALKKHDTMKGPMPGIVASGLVGLEDVASLKEHIAALEATLSTSVLDKPIEKVRAIQKVFGEANRFLDKVEERDPMEAYPANK